ncbi:hypothetical protein B0H11DRAFT_2355108 [Mycena galericulata]|nr:hypothetical protein B0H11DRAFT_2355108 [Mycena galericulata]
MPPSPLFPKEFPEPCVPNYISTANYGRWLDLDQAIAPVTWTQPGSAFTRQHISSSGALPPLSFAFSSSLEDGLPTPNITCLDSSTLRVRGCAGVPGMLYEMLGRVRATGGIISCAAASALLSGPPSTMAYTDLRAAHFSDFAAAVGGFTLDIGQQPQLRRRTATHSLQWLMFNYGRYLLASSSRGALLANLSRFPDSNINIQMNYWSAEMSNLDVILPLFTYIEILYNISRGWVTYDEIFGHTGMKAPGKSAE